MRGVALGGVARKPTAPKMEVHKVDCSWRWSHPQIQRMQKSCAKD